MHNVGNVMIKTYLLNISKWIDAIKFIKANNRNFSLLSLPEMHIQILSCKHKCRTGRKIWHANPPNETGSDNAPESSNTRSTALSDCGPQNGEAGDLKWKRSILRMQMYFRMCKPKVMWS